MAIVRRHAFFFVIVLLLACNNVALANIKQVGGIADWGKEPLDDGARCDVNAVRRANREQLHLLLEELTNTTFFRLFRVGLDGECPSSASSSSPKAKEEAEDTPSCATIASPDSPAAEGQCTLNLGGPFDSPLAKKEKDLPPWVLHKQPVDRTISPKEKSSLKSDLSCETPDFWFDMCHGLLSEDESKGWINLQLNPERHTGYNGSKVWKAIYEEACFAERIRGNNNNNNTPTAAGEEQNATCGHEERVLQRLLSGLHASINTHISLFFYPPASSTNANDWKANPARFMETVGSHPERLRNLNFAFVVLLRALRKASPILSSFSYAVSGDGAEDLRTAALVRRLLDAHLMSSCSQVFDSFDESLMFQNRTSELKKAFKHAFLNISRTFDCIKCQKCRLHGKMQLTGIGTALKILLLPDDVLAKTPINQLARREEIVALFNTLYKFSHAIASVDFLTELNLAQEQLKSTSVITEDVVSLSQKQATVLPSSSRALKEGEKEEDDKPGALNANTLDDSIGAIARAYFKGALTDEEESALLRIAAAQSSDVLASLARHYGSVSSDKFAQHVRSLVLLVPKREEDEGVVVVVGSGLAGSSAVLTLLDSNKIQKVLLIEKQGFLGGNSVYASSGMNAVDDEARGLGDSVELFAMDMAKSSGRGEEFAQDPLVKTLTSEAEEGLRWVRERVNQPFSSLGKLGGHSKARTHRPEQGMAGADLVYAIHKLFKPYLEDGRLEILKSTRVVDVMLKDSRKIQALEILSRNNSRETIANVRAVIFATGGYSANKKLLPAWMSRFGTTNGAFATGDAIEILRKRGAQFVDLDKVQLHPTAFSVSSLSSNDDEVKGHQQPLCAEILRGVGAILLNARGKRFCDELGTRAYVSQKMLEHQEERDFVLLMTEEQAQKAKHFVSMYTKRMLLREFTSLEQIEEWMGVSVRQALKEYASGADSFGKTTLPLSGSFVTTAKYYAGRVQPAVHYCMGGVQIDAWGRVLRTNVKGDVMEGVYAAGEVTGGVHGNNRLGGNGMTEGVVFGRKTAQAVLLSNGQVPAEPAAIPKLKQISLQDLAKHSTAKDCWVAIRNKVYDFTAFLADHPGGAQAIMDVAGRDGTALYEEIHTMAFLDDFTPVAEIVNK